MPFNQFLFFSSFFLYLFIKIRFVQTSLIKIIPPDSHYNKIFSEDEDEEDLITKDQNCNFTEYPENAEKCDLDHMECEDKIYLHFCGCKEGYITYPTTNVTKYCNREQKKQVYAFWLEFICGFGAGHFYRHAYTVASWKLVAFLFGLVFLCGFPVIAKLIGSDCGCECLAFIISILSYLYMVFLAVWYIYDLVNFGNNNFKDYTYYPILINLKRW